MKKRSYNILLILVLIYTIVHRFLICKYLLKFNECLTSVFCLILLLVTYKLLGYRKTINNDNNKKIIKNVVIKLLLFFLFYYVIGFITGFLKNSYSTNIIDIIKNSIFILVIYICIELFRYMFISSNKDDKKYISLLTIVLIIFDTNLLIRFNTFNNIETIFSFITLSFLPTILNNVVLSYLTYTSNNFKASMIYRLVMELYIYIVPVVPDINDHINSLLLLLLPFSILISTSKVFVIKEEKPKKVKKSDYIFLGIIFILVLLIFGIGPFKMIGIETASMSPNYNIGDAVIINKYVDKNNLKENDVIAYYDENNKIIVHRIVKVNSDKTYITKGDMNNTSDNKYVKPDKVYGKVIFRIPYIAYPAVKLKGK